MASEMLLRALQVKKPKAAKPAAAAAPAEGAAPAAEKPKVPIFLLYLPSPVSSVFCAGVLSRRQGPSAAIWAAHASIMSALCAPEQ